MNFGIEGKLLHVVSTDVVGNKSFGAGDTLEWLFDFVVFEALDVVDFFDPVADAQADLMFLLVAVAVVDEDSDGSCDREVMALLWVA